MFISSFPFKKINSQSRIIDNVHLVEHNYQFRGKSNKRYIVVCEQYDFNVYAVKFYAVDHKFCANKFKRLTGNSEGSRIITTVSKIMIELLKDNPFASFAFVGSPLLNEEQSNTKRFKLYAKVVGNLVGPIFFEQHFDESKSAYILLNKNNEDKFILDKIQALFSSIYDL